MEKKLTQKEIEEQELAGKVLQLLVEKTALSSKMSNGVTLEKSWYIGDRSKEIEKELSELKTNPSDNPSNKQQ